MKHMLHCAAFAMGGLAAAEQFCSGEVGLTDAGRAGKWFTVGQNQPYHVWLGEQVAVDQGEIEKHPLKILLYRNIYVLDVPATVVTVVSVVFTFQAARKLV